MRVKWIFGLIVFALLAVLIAQNTQFIVYRVFFWQIGISQVILVPALLLAGFIFGFAVAKLRKGPRGKLPSFQREMDEEDEID